MRLLDDGDVRPPDEREVVVDQDHVEPAGGDGAAVIVAAPDGEADRPELALVPHPLELADGTGRSEDEIHVDAVERVDLHEIDGADAEHAQALLDRPASGRPRVITVPSGMHAHLGAEMKARRPPAEVCQELAVPALALSIERRAFDVVDPVVEGATHGLERGLLGDGTIESAEAGASERQ